MLLQVVDELKNSPTSMLKSDDNWRAFIGEEAPLSVLYAEAPDTPSKSCILKARGGRRRAGGGACARSSMLA